MQKSVMCGCIINCNVDLYERCNFTVNGDASDLLQILCVCVCACLCVCYTKVAVLCEAMCNVIA